MDSNQLGDALALIDKIQRGISILVEQGRQREERERAALDALTVNVVAADPPAGDTPPPPPDFPMRFARLMQDGDQVRTGRLALPNNHGVLIYAAHGRDRFTLDLEPPGGDRRRIYDGREG